MTFFSTVLILSICILGVAMLIALYRFTKGPTLADRIASLDLIAADMIATLVIYVMITDKFIFFDIALVFSLVAFLGSMSFAYYLINSNSK
ncbi:cation:proton antiporter [Olivibacter sp. SDN3]|uniref:monovalent cation/H+ antiporter complex subunit F n=1 Tax=Olivibacter sp. SDN3 TaxID=2764720 RepID=UPI0016515643|nr:monovalent cation/H+ antiporter complex subunit F [Olivibacter sp. SDN3]QNL49086.1 cation:proton antiporter [Olivibacter sp. SDN3]